MLRNAPGIRRAPRAAIAASAVLIGAALAPLRAQQMPAAAPPARPTSIAQLSHTIVAPGAFSLEQILSYPYVEEMIASPTQSRFAWVVVRAGVRNVWGASGPAFTPRQLTDYRADDGQELTNLSISSDGKVVVFVRGGDHDANWDAEGGLQPDPNHSPVQPKIQIWAVAFGDGAARPAPKLLADGDMPVLSPRGDRVVFSKDNQLSVVPIDGSSPAKSLFFSRGTVGSAVWSPSGDRLAFVTSRGDHSFVGVFSSDSAPILYLAPSTSNDMAPAWSPDGKRIAFVRRPGSGGVPETLLDLHPDPWEIWTADAASGAGHLVWQSPKTLRGSFPGDTHLAFAAGDRLVFLSDMDGWPHLYSVPESGGAPLLLTPGAFMAEYVSETPDHTAIVYNANTGTTRGDYDRRHLFRVPVDRAAPLALTSGEGLEWNPAISGDGRTVAFIGAGAQRPPLPMVVPLTGGTPRVLSPELIPASFPTAGLVIPKPVVFKAADGTEIHGQLFARAGADTRVGNAAKKPGIIFVHGGPPRQMLLGWHYMDYYSNAYAVNQYLANHGYVVLAVNYRLGIGYGHDFNNPPHSGPWGASEYQDVQAGAAYLRALPDVESSKIGIWGGSYGGYLTALALARNSDVFKAGVDLHGVHNWIADFGSELTNQQLHYEKGDIKQALDVAWQSSPVASMATWKSPVLLIQGDDDRNVHFHETVDLARRLADHHVSYEELVFPDEIHGFLRYSTWLTADRATVDYFDRKFLGATQQTR
ncbi:MAG TPA: prolyl oligopeptidase family serine peptidase [Gemmatimonadaceae bacterium]